MTEAEKNEIVGLVMTEISSQAVDFDITTEQPQANDLLTAVREVAGRYVGVTLKWDDVARIATEVANRAAERAEQAETNANNILERVQSKGTEITNFVATSKAEIETQKNESVNAVKSVYQTDLDELKGDLDEYGLLSYPYPLKNKNEYADKTSCILGIYIKEKIDGADYYLRCFRYMQEGTAWDGKYTQIQISYNLNNERKDFNIVDEFNVTRSGIEVIESEIAIIVIDWDKATEGYGYAFGIDERVRLSDYIFESNRYISDYIQRKENDLKYQEFIKPNAVEINIKNYLQNKLVDDKQIISTSSSISAIDIPVQNGKSYCIITKFTDRSYVNTVVGIFAYKDSVLLRHQYINRLNTDRIIFENNIDADKINVQLLYVKNPYDAVIRYSDILLMFEGETFEIDKINGFSIKCDDSYVQQLENHINAENPHNITPSKIGLLTATQTNEGLMSASDKRKIDNLENASDSKSGLMSASDKQKLDNIISPITVSIEGSGITKNASAYGFLPTNDAETNSIALQNAVNGGGTIIVDLAGVYPICKSLILDSNTTLIFGNGVYLRREADSNGVIARYPFINRGAFTREYNENISIIGLNLLTNGYGSGTDVGEIYGQGGQLAFYCIRHLTIKDLTIPDGTAIYYNIHIQNFEDIHLENIHIFSAKDGIHLGKGKDFVIKNVWLKTNDDGIALNAHDYPTGTSELGWIENGLIENVHFMSAPDFNTGRGIYFLGGAWKDWSSGMEVRKYGDTVVSNGRIYRTVSSPISQTKETIVSTVQPSHESGVQTYSDGVTWLMAQDNDICYNAGCRNVHIKDVFCDRLSSGMLTFNFDNDIYSRSIYPSCELPMMENITLDGVYGNANVITHIVNACAPFKNLKLRNLNCQSKNTIIFMHSVNTDFVYPESTAMLSDCTFFNNDNQDVLIIRNDLKLKAKICNSLVINDSAKFSKYGTNVRLISNDLGIN